jgi:NAD(P)-dependent dehydrogenase (short-subunit alcohol dehydrogenase family)
MFAKRHNRPKFFDLDETHVVITGGSQGIGYNLAVLAFKKGANVSVIARNQSRLEKVRTKLENLQKKYPKLRSQHIQVESLDISTSFEETKQVFEKVGGLLSGYFKNRNQSLFQVVLNSSQGHLFINLKIIFIDLIF